MARIAGIEVTNEKKVWISLMGIYGIGTKRAHDICKDTNIDENTFVKDLSEVQLDVIRKYIEEKYQVEGALRQGIFRDIKRLKDIRCYRGIRHKLGLPVRGQRTRHNAHTRKGKTRAVGGLKRVLAKT
ncbi:MAG: 30S ribosomal protein S13 [candidate division WS6 bacterium GW2011_GWC2_36_7]|uniref:Small ribosomal subunit protein uS13 n=2 Tax=Candidatus Dojkabacteria TaxID=74243 RepID=A0A0G0FCP2_9BACT|nr:MAG: 30S ribosomal protein S13 [candidate division WS6 bacterium GW2011_GWC2_36_7]KKQ10931.1 MAG: 30S ribosomal protein S13 [candidate division WS6 bacterium GW2011_GWE1_36_69]KKQ15697.1 MAG: 30S ribosomal protein S13 [candidate division WS6 bacterium GW2011_GWF1_36_8]HAM37665.1 30S ribosomal protein S13 [Patescibacteria group bacterium]HAM96410.1 30S ribosomal protein S13 [Patescibacteria group bacterium]